MSPEWSDFVLATDVPDSKAYVLILNCLDVKSNCWNSCDNLTKEKKAKIRWGKKQQRDSWFLYLFRLPRPISIYLKSKIQISLGRRLTKNSGFPCGIETNHEYPQRIVLELQTLKRDASVKSPHVLLAK